MILVDHVAGPVAEFIVYAVFGLVPLVFVSIALVATLRALFRAAQARLAERGSGTLKQGRTVLRGPVEYAVGENLAVRVEITQMGRNIRRNDGTGTFWTEIFRNVEARPFYIRDVRGPRVRVEPPQDVALVDALDETSPTDKAGTRVRSAALKPGEEVHAFGALVHAPDPEAVSGYRSSEGVRLVLRGRRGRMLISSQPLASMFLGRARFHAIYGAIALLIAALMQLFVLDYHRLNVSGHVESATVVSTRTWTTTRRKTGNTTQHAAVRLRLADGRELEEEVEPEGVVGVAQGSQIPVVRAGSLVQPGKVPSVYKEGPYTCVLVFAFFAVFYIVFWRESRPWFDKKLEESTDDRTHES